jgi:CheY-like chemotaxis protein
MGGSVTAESTLGRGSVFTVDLPLVVAEAPPAPATDRAVRPKPRDGAFAAGAAVLLVEDHEVNRAVASAMLGGFGCLVDVAQDGIEAVRMAIAKPYRMVFMDIQMPRMDGLNATRAIRGHEARSGRQRTPIVGLTCLAHDDDRTRGLAAGMDAYLTKPIDPDEVAWVLERHLQAQSPTPDRTPAPSPDPTPGTDPVPVLDPAVAARLRGLADGLAASLWTEFAAELPARMAEITASATAGDAAETHRLLHTLKGAAGTLGLTRLFRALARADELSRQQAAGWQAAATGLGPVCTESQAAARSAAGAAPG